MMEWVILIADMTGKEITVYKGDPIASSGFYSELAETLKVKQLDNKNTLTAVLPATNGKVVLPELTEAQITALNENRTLTIGTDQSYKYMYPRTSDAVGYFTYTYKISETPGGNAQDHKAGDPGNPAEQYTLEVNFVPYTVADRTAANATIAPAVNGGTAVTKNLTKTANYKVNIIAGAIEITKILAGDQQVSEETEFSFKVTGPDLFEKIIKLTVTYDEEANQYVATYLGNDADNELKNLARGTYTVTEIETEGYQVKDTPIVGKKTDTWYTQDNEQDTVTFELGYHKANNGEKADVIVNKKYDSKDGGVLGQVTYTNEAVYKNWAVIKVSESSKEQKIPDAEFTLTKNGKVECYGKSDANGKVHWFEDLKYSKEVTKIPAGTYELKEVKAPVGYVLTNDTYNLVITKNGALKSVTKGNQEVEMEVADDEYKIYIENKVIYDLPSTGHTGIFNILMSGILLMFAGILIIYKMKGKEVLKK